MSLGGENTASLIENFCQLFLEKKRIRAAPPSPSVNLDSNPSLTPGYFWAKFRLVSEPVSKECQDRGKTPIVTIFSDGHFLDTSETEGGECVC